jgi:hypothetical protein
MLLHSRRANFAKGNMMKTLMMIISLTLSGFAAHASDGDIARMDYETMLEKSTQDSSYRIGSSSDGKTLTAFVSHDEANGKTTTCVQLTNALLEKTYYCDSK